MQLISVKELPILLQVREIRNCSLRLLKKIIGRSPSGEGSSHQSSEIETLITLGLNYELGLVGKYNSKLMCNRLILPGGCCVTPQSYISPSYCNFYPPKTRWQFNGIRGAQTAKLPKNVLT